MSTENILHLDHVTMQFGGVVAVNDLSVDVNKGQIVALIGPNGAGKTTAFNCITGVYEPTNGLVSFCGEPMVRNHPRGRWPGAIWGARRPVYRPLLRGGPGGQGRRGGPAGPGRQGPDAGRL